MSTLLFKGRESLDSGLVDDSSALLVNGVMLSVEILLNLMEVQVRNLSTLTVEDLGEFLERGAAGLDVEEVDEEELEKVPDCVEHAEGPCLLLLLEVVPRDGVGVVPEHQSCLNGQVHDHDSLGSELVWEDLEGVRDEETRPSERVEDAEEPDEDDLRISCGLGVLSTSLLVLRGDDGPGQEHGNHTGSRGQEEWATSDTFDEESTADGDDERKHGLSTVKLDIVSHCISSRSGGWTYRNLLVLFCDAGTLVDEVHVVTEESIARVLGNYTKRDEDSQTISVALGAEEIGVSAGLLVLELEAECLLDLAELESNSGVLLVAIGVVLGKNGLGFLVTLLGYQPTWGFWDPLNEC